MNGTSDKKALVKAAEDFLAAAQAFSEDDAMARAGLMKQADRLRMLAEDGFGTIMRQWDAIHLKAALNVLTSLGILKRVPQEGSIGSEELASAVNIDESVVQRTMRIAVAQGIALEPSPNHYVHNAKSLAYVTGSSQYFFKFLSDHGEALTSLPRYFATHSREELTDNTKTPYAFSKDMEGSTYYQVISADPERFELFNHTLAHMEETIPVLGMFPFSSMKAQVEAEPHRPFIVDVGGGIGRVVKSILQEAPNGFGAEVVLQDRADVIDAVEREGIPNVTLMVHDFFTPQPVKNAHLYLLRRILHDFYDPACIDIVKNIASAMGPTSRLLVGDCVVPEKANVGDDFFVYWIDLSMMVIGGQEKTAEQFTRIFDAAGLELVKIWPAAFGAQSMVEAKLKA